MAKQVQVGRQFILESFKDLSMINKRRIEMSFLRIINEYLFNRTLNNKDYDNRSFPSYSKQYRDFKERFLKGKIKGRGGGRSRTVASIKRRMSQHNSTYAASNVNDKMRLSGLLLSSLKVQDVKLIKIDKRVVITYRVGVGKSKIGDTPALDLQAQGLAKNGYKFIGFKNKIMPPDLVRALKAAYIRIMNESK